MILPNNHLNINNPVAKRKIGRPTKESWKPGEVVKKYLEKHKIKVEVKRIEKNNNVQ